MGNPVYTTSDKSTQTSLSEDEEYPPVYDDYDYSADDEWFTQPTPCYCTETVLCRWCFNTMRQRLESLSVETPIR
jgi:hypothetical protein